MCRVGTIYIIDIYISVIYIKWVLLVYQGYLVQGLQEMYRKNEKKCSLILPIAIFAYFLVLMFLTYINLGSALGSPVSFRLLSHSASLAQNTLLMVSHSLIHLPPAHHSHPPYIHCFIPGSKLTFSTNLFHHSLLAPTWTAFSDYTGPDFSAQRFFIFS